MEKIYAGTARMLTTQFGTLPKVTFSRKDLNTLLQYLNDNDTEFVSLNVKEKPQKVEGKPTHYLQVDEWKPNAVKEKKEFKPVDNKIYNQGPERARYSGGKFNLTENEESTLPF